MSVSAPADDADDDADSQVTGSSGGDGQPPRSEMQSYTVRLAPIIDVDVRDVSQLAAQIKAEWELVEAMDADAGGLGDGIAVRKLQLLGIQPDQREAFAKEVADAFGVEEDMIGWAADSEPGDEEWGRPPEDTDLDI